MKHFSWGGPTRSRGELQRSPSARPGSIPVCPQSAYGGLALWKARSRPGFPIHPPSAPHAYGRSIPGHPQAAYGGLTLWKAHPRLGFLILSRAGVRDILGLPKVAYSGWTRWNVPSRAGCPIISPSRRSWYPWPCPDGRWHVTITKCTIPTGISHYFPMPWVGYSQGKPRISVRTTGSLYFRPCLIENKTSM